MSTKPTNLNSFGRFQRLLRRDPHLALPQQLLDEVGDVSPGDGDVLDAAADDIAFSLDRKCEEALRGGGGGWNEGDTVQHLPPG